MTHLNLKKNYVKNDGILSLAVNKKNGLRIFLKSLLRLLVYLRKQGDLQNQMGLGQV